MWVTPTLASRRPTCGAMPQPVSFTTTGTAELAHEARDGLEARAEVAIAARLHELHRRVQVDAQRVGADLVGERAHLAVLISRAWTTPTFPSTSGARARLRARGTSPRPPCRTCIARWLPRPKAIPRSSARLASSRLMRPASSVPPVIGGDDERRAELLAEERQRRVDRVCVRDRGGRRARGGPDRRAAPSSGSPTSPVAQRAMWSLFRCPIDWSSAHLRCALTRVRRARQTSRSDRAIARLLTESTLLDETQLNPVPRCVASSKKCEIAETRQKKATSWR